MRRRKTITSCLCLAAVFTGSCLPANTEAGDFLKSIFKGPGVTQKEPCVERLAQEIDWLERHIDQYGSVVAKQPDIWGQARLTKHREEYEKIMANELDQFHLYVNGSVSRSDQAYLANAFALSAAVSSGRATRPNSAPAGREYIEPGKADLTLVNTLAPNITSQSVSYDKDGVPTVAGAGSPATNPGTVFATAPVHLQGAQLSGFGATGIALEPTLALDQRSRYLQHLHELRRINEGDDTADSPGYALNLVRIPVSLLPGKLSQKGYGAEVTITATPYLSENLLPTTFRSLVLNDLVQQLSLPITRISDELAKQIALKGERDIAARSINATDIELKQVLMELSSTEREIQELEAGIVKQGLNDPRTKTDPELKSVAEQLEILRTVPIAERNISQMVSANFGPTQAELTSDFRDRYVRKHAKSRVSDAVKAELSVTPGSTLKVEDLALQLDRKKLSKEDLIKRKDDLSTRRDDLGKQKLMYQQKLESLDALSRALAIKTVHGPSPRGRRSSDPLPPSQLAAVLGDQQLEVVATVLTEAYYGPNVRWKGTKSDRLHLPDVQRFLQAELDAAYDLYARLPDELLINIISGGQLAERVRKGDLTGVAGLRLQFLNAIANPMRAGLGEMEPPVVDSSTTDGLQILPPEAIDKKPVDIEVQKNECVQALAWAIVVEAALLNDRLTLDIVNAAQAKGCPCQGAEQHMYFLYRASPEACQTFNEYVRCRWPIHVFALDPVTQDQNITDAFSRRRELQLAVALAFTSGRMNAANMTRFVRRLESDFETVALNRTIVGFSHGDDTFGWQFFPRFQTPPPTTGTLRVLGETLFGAQSPDCELVQRKIEPGMRECTAVVIMPSFVPYLTFDVRTNWFRLNHHHHVLHPRQHATEQSMTDIMKLSRSIKSMHDTAAQVCDANCYRDGDVERLVTRVHQLDRELPLQSMRVQVPIENTLGGFEMFNNGTTDLAPELDGWYGGPGIRRGQPTTLFLVGDHFSVHHTLVVAGDRPIHPDDRMLLSRQIMQVTIPPDVAISRIDDEEFVDVHIATPYGVTSHLHIPVDNGPPPGGAPAPRPEGWKPLDFKLYCTKEVGEDKKITFKPQRYEIEAPGTLSIFYPDRTSSDTSDLQFQVYSTDRRFLGGFTTAGIAQDKATGAFKLEGAVLGKFLTEGVTTALKSENLAALLGEGDHADVEILAGLVVGGVTKTVPGAPLRLHIELLKQP